MAKRKTKTKAQRKKAKARHTININTRKNQIANYQNAMIERQQLFMRCNIIEQIYKSKPELAVDIEGKLQLNKDVVNIEEDVLYWTETKNPVLSGLDARENYSKYSEELFNNVLEAIQQRETQSEGVDMDMEDFELIEEDLESDEA